jgi:hypothetical protein
MLKEIACEMTISAIEEDAILKALYRLHNPL